MSKERAANLMKKKIEKGELTPVFFGSALTNFGVKTFLDAYLQFAPAPAKHRTEEGNFVEPKMKNFPVLSSRFRRT